MLLRPDASARRRISSRTARWPRWTPSNVPHRDDRAPSIVGDPGRKVGRDREGVRLCHAGGPGVVNTFRGRNRPSCHSPTATNLGPRTATMGRVASGSGRRGRGASHRPTERDLPLVSLGQLDPGKVRQRLGWGEPTFGEIGSRCDAVSRQGGIDRKASHRGTSELSQMRSPRPEPGRGRGPTLGCTCHWSSGSPPVRPFRRSLVS